jgi:hypothetical protein
LSNKNQKISVSLIKDQEISVSDLKPFTIL